MERNESLLIILICNLKKIGINKNLNFYVSKLNNDKNVEEMVKFLMYQKRTKEQFLEKLKEIEKRQEY